MSTDFELRCVLFDLDGTLINTAPDLIACLNQALTQHGFDQVPNELVQPLISYGATAMINASIQVDKTIQANILTTMLSLYENNIAQYSHFFAGIEDCLNTIESLNLKWGIITNKQQRFTQPLVKAFQLVDRASCIISGDTTAHSKPHPEPMLTACALASVSSEQCVYIGDARHDIDAGHNTNMQTLAATYGYIKADDNPADWGANALIDSPQQITQWILARC